MQVDRFMLFCVDEAVRHLQQFAHDCSCIQGDDLAVVVQLQKTLLLHVFILGHLFV